MSSVSLVVKALLVDYSTLLKVNDESILTNPEIIAAYPKFI